MKKDNASSVDGTPEKQPREARWVWRLVSLFWVAARIPAQLPIVLGLLIAALMIAIGKWGDTLNDTLDDLNHSLCMVTSPRAWKLLKKWKEERDMFERDLSFWKGEVQRLQDEADKANGVSATNGK